MTTLKEKLVEAITDDVVDAVELGMKIVLPGESGFCSGSQLLVHGEHLLMIEVSLVKDFDDNQ
jgi:hypothetical protein